MNYIPIKVLPLNHSKVGHSSLSRLSNCVYQQLDRQTQTWTCEIGLNDVGETEDYWETFCTFRHNTLIMLF